MSVGFGFSVGDFLAALDLVGTIIDALRRSSQVISSFRSLINELYTLESALLRVKRLDLDDNHTVETLALRQAASQCQRTIDAFYKKIQKYQPQMLGGSDSRIKDGWARIKWAVCKKDDIEEFRAEIRGHTSSLEILLITVQMQATTMDIRQRDSQHRSLAGKIQDLSCQALGKLSAITYNVAQSVQQGKELLESSARIVQMNLRVFKMVHDIQLFILRIPGQVQRQQPVYLIDAFNKESPFHLEFVRSAEALLAVLKLNLRDTGCGPDMIDQGEFVIEESGTQDAIDIMAPWESCFYPGQRVAMSMIFKQRTAVISSCPRCGKDYEESMGKEITCIDCGVVFRRIKEVDEDIRGPNQNPEQTKEQIDHPHNELDLRHSPEKPMNGPSQLRKREREEDITSQNVRKFRRVQIISRNQSKWASEDKIGQKELYEAAEQVLQKLKHMTEYSSPFLRRVSMREAPDYLNIIKNPMDLDTIQKNLDAFEYKSKTEFVDDLNLIWSNCLRYNRDPRHPIRRKALVMQNLTNKLVIRIPDILVRDRAEVEAEEHRNAHLNYVDDSDDEPIMASRGRSSVASKYPSQRN